MDYSLNKLVDISHSSFLVLYRGVRRRTAALSDKKDFMSSTHFKVALTRGGVLEDVLGLKDVVKDTF